MLSNPLIQRYRASHLGIGSIAVYLGIYAVVVLLGGMSCAASADVGESGSFDKFSSFMFFLLAAIQVFLLWGFGTYNSAQAIRMEHERKSYDFFRMLPMTASEKALGIMIGRNLPILLLVAVNTILMLLISPDQLMHGQLQCIIWTGAAALSTLALLSSCRPHTARARRKTNGAVLVILCLVLFQYFVGICFTLGRGLGEESPLAMHILFGSGSIPLFLAITLIAAMVGAWCYAGVLRRLTVEDMPLFTRSGAILFSGMLIGLILMFIVPHLDDGNRWSAFGSIVISGTIIIILALTGTLNLSVHYIESCRRAGDTTRRAIRSRLARLSNLWPATGLLGVQLVAVAIIALPSALKEGSNMLSVLLGMLVTYGFAVLLAELTALYYGTNRHVLLLASFAGILYCVVPLVVGALSGSEFYMLSGPNYTFVRLAKPAGLDFTSAILLVEHLVLLGAMYVWIRKRANELAESAASIS